MFSLPICPHCKETALYTEAFLAKNRKKYRCKNCGEIYNLKFKPPKNENVCDKCGGELVQRKDDNEETAKARFDTYYRETAPLIEYYKSKGVLSTIDANGSIDDVWERLLKVVE